MLYTKGGVLGVTERSSDACASGDLFVLLYFYLDRGKHSCHAGHHGDGDG